MKLEHDLLNELGELHGAAYFVQRKLTAKKLSATAAAKVLGVSPSTLTRFLNGGGLSVEMAAKLQDKLGLDAQTLFNLEAQANTRKVAMLLSA